MRRQEVYDFEMKGEKKFFSHQFFGLDSKRVYLRHITIMPQTKSDVKLTELDDAAHVIEASILSKEGNAPRAKCSKCSSSVLENVSVDNDEIDRRSDDEKAHSCDTLNDNSHDMGKLGAIKRFSSLNWLSKRRRTLSFATPTKNETWSTDKLENTALNNKIVRKQPNLTLVNLANAGMKALSTSLFVVKTVNTGQQKVVYEDPLPEIFDDGNFVMIDGLISLLPEEVRYGRRSPNY